MGSHDSSSKKMAEEQDPLQVIQKQFAVTKKSHAQVTSALNSYERERRRKELTLRELSTMEDGTTTYVTVGMMYLAKDMSAIIADTQAYQAKITEHDKTKKKLEERMASLEKEFTS